ncbi:hypothetical protein [Mesorhizobium carmichaelinearum]|uniref:hypothetical protein n=1 Tax=Mesorhizobium carmichaelinearum TaxID=1208188 RepID=UPI000BA39476|nr:hypothetical protein [Mesorhizobium carmichaelinearum]
MFERGRHAVDFGLADAGISSDAAPVRDGFTDLPRDRARILGLEAEISGNRKGKIERDRGVLLVMAVVRTRSFTSTGTGFTS